MLWVATTFVGSALLFAVQPMIARMLLPRLGGAQARLEAGDIAIPVVLALATALLILLADRLRAAGQVREVLTAGLPALPAYLASNRPLRFGLSAGAVLLAGSLDSGLRGPAMLSERSFFGIHRVTRAAMSKGGRPAALHRLYHGTTIHGVQRADVASGAPVGPRDPLGYYSIGSPIGWLFRSFPPGARPRRVGLVGLGADACSRMGSRWAFLARSADRLPPHGPAPVGPPSDAAAARVWTDDRSDAWSLFRW